MTHSTEPNDLIPKKDNPKIVQFQNMEYENGGIDQTILLCDGRLLERAYSHTQLKWLEWIDITGELPE